MELLEKIYFDHHLREYLLFAGILILGVVLRKVLSRLITSLLYGAFKKRFISVGVEQFTNLLFKPCSFLIVVVTIYIAFKQLHIPTQWKISLDDSKEAVLVSMLVFKTALVYGFAWLAVRSIEYFGLVLAVRASKTESKTDDMMIPFIKESLKIIVVILAIFFLLGTVFDLNIAALLGGAGIAGLAIALAAQETLGNLLGSFTIFLDKPFVVGDMIKVGTTQGRVENIGFRSTRIRTLERSYVTIPNKKMVDAELDNLTERLLYRTRMLVGFRYDSKAAALKGFIEDTKAYLKSKPDVDDGLAVHLHDMTDSTLQVVVLFFVKTNEWDVMIAVKEDLIYKMMEIAEAHHLQFAFPSTSVYMEPSN